MSGNDTLESGLGKLKMLGDEAGVSGDELAEYLTHNKTITLAISLVEETTDKNNQKCIKIRLVGDVFDGRTVTQKYTRTQARELYQAFVKLNPDYAKGKSIEGGVFEWNLGIKPGSTIYPRLAPVSEAA